MEDTLCKEEVRCAAQYVTLLLGVDDDPVPSTIHLNGELFVLTESVPRVKSAIKFSSSLNGPRCQAIYDSIAYNYSWFAVDNNAAISLTAEGKLAFDSYKQQLGEKDPPYLDELVSALELVRIFYDDFTQDELLLLLSDYHKEYFTSLTDDKEYIKNREKISLRLLERDLITESRYQELMGHPVEQ
jgi:hypothetical protein